MIEGVYIFPKNIRPNVNVMARLEFELAYFEPITSQWSRLLYTAEQKKRLGQIKIFFLKKKKKT